MKVIKGKCYMQSSSAFLYAEWAGRLGFLLLEYDCRMVPIILKRTVRFTTILVGQDSSWAGLELAGLSTHQLPAPGGCPCLRTLGVVRTHNSSIFC